MSKFFKSEYFISFFAAVAVITLAFAIAHVYPFGTYTAACSDMRMQFLNLTAALFDRIKGGRSIFVTYSGGLGTAGVAPCRCGSLRGPPAPEGTVARGRGA